MATDTQSASDTAVDWANRHAINMSRIEAGQVENVNALLVDLEAKLASILIKSDLKPGQAAKLETIHGAAATAIGKTYGSIAGQMEMALQDTAAMEAKAAGQLLNSQIGVDVFGPVLTEKQWSAVANKTLIFGHSSGDWWASQDQALRFKFAGAMQEGYSLGESVDDLIRRVRGTKANGYSDGIMATSRREAEALVRSSIQTISNQARLAGYEENKDLYKGIQWHATLDGRTTTICMALNKLEWRLPDYKPIGHTKDFPGPTAHWNCRSTQIGILRSWEELSGKKIQALDGQTLQDKLQAKLAKKGMAPEQAAKAMANAQASMDGQVPAELNYEDWLAGKSDEYASKVLGPGRFALWKSGKLQLRHLTDQKNRPLTIAQLEAAISGDGFPVETEGVQYLPPTGPVPKYAAQPIDTDLAGQQPTIYKLEQVQDKHDERIAVVKEFLAQEGFPIPAKLMEPDVEMGSARGLIYESILSANYPNSYILRDATGRIIAAVDYTDLSAGWLNIEHIGSIAPGGGTQALKAVLERAAKDGHGVTVMSMGPTPEGSNSHKFYQKWGFVPQDDHDGEWMDFQNQWMTLEAKQVKKTLANLEAYNSLATKGTASIPEADHIAAASKALPKYKVEQVGTQDAEDPEADFLSRQAAMDEFMAGPYHDASENSEMIKMALMDEGETFILRDTDGQIVGAMSYATDGDTIELRSIGSVKKGAGKQMIQIVLEAAQADDMPVDLGAIPGAVTFYEKLGFKKLKKEGNYTQFTADGPTQKKILANLAAAADEAPGTQINNAEAEAQIAAILANPKGQTLKAAALKKLQKEQPDLTPSDMLAMAEGIAQEKQAAASKASVLSQAKKKLVAGETPTPAQWKLLNDLPEDEKNAFLASVEEGKKANAAGIYAELDKLIDATKGKLSASELDKLNLLPADQVTYLNGKIIAHQQDETVATIKADFGSLDELNANPEAAAKFAALPPLLKGEISDHLTVKYETKQATDQLAAWKASADPMKVAAANQAEASAQGLKVSALSIWDQAEQNLLHAKWNNLVDGIAGPNATKLKQAAFKKATGYKGDFADAEQLKTWMEDNVDPFEAADIHDTVMAEAAAKQAAASKASKLSTAKQKILDGKTPSPSEQATIDALTPEEKAAWESAVQDAKAVAGGIAKGGKVTITAPPTAINPNMPEWATKVPKSEEDAIQIATDAIMAVPDEQKGAMLEDLGIIPDKDYLDFDDFNAQSLKATLEQYADMLIDGDDDAPSLTDMIGEIQKLALGELAKKAPPAPKQQSIPKVKPMAKTTAKAIAKEPGRPPITGTLKVPEPSTLTTKQRLGGSTGAMLAVDSQGKQWVVKKGASPEHVRAEAEADAIYRALGFETPEGAIFETKDGPIKVTEYLEGGKTLAQLTTAERKAANAKLKDGIAADMVLGNWDVIGAGADNVMVTPDGRVWRIDNGGALSFRAMGDPKEGDEWNGYPTEIWSMRDKQKNATAASVYGDADIFEIARKIQAVDWSRIEKLPMADETKRLVMQRAAEAKRIATRALDLQHERFRPDYVERLTRDALEMRQAGVMAGAPEKLIVQDHTSIKDVNGRAFGNLRAGSTGGGATAQAKMPGDYWSANIEVAVKSLAHKAINDLDISDGSAIQKANAAIAHKAVLEDYAKSGSKDEKAMAKEYLKTIKWIEDQVAKGGIPAKPAMFKPYLPANTPAPAVQDARSLVQRWEAQMAAKGIDTTPIQSWLSSQSGNSWTPATQAAKYAFSLGMENPADRQYWDGNSSYPTSLAGCKKEFDKVAAKLGSQEKALELFTSYHALVQETLTTIKDVPWIDPERRAVLLFRTVANEELAGSYQAPTVNPAWQREYDALLARTTKPTKAQLRQLEERSDRYLKSEFIPKRGTTESHSIYKTTKVYGSQITATAVPFSRIYGLYWLERYGGHNGSSFLGDGEAEFAANTSGLPSVFNQGFVKPKLDATSQQADKWGVPLDHLPEP